jgi:hypothetical protein
MILSYEGKAAVAGLENLVKPAPSRSRLGNGLLDNWLVFLDGNDVVDRLRGSSGPNALATFVGAKGFALSNLRGGQGRVSWLVFAKSADSFRPFARLNGEFIGTAYWNLIFLSFHTDWTTARHTRRRL